MRKDIKRVTLADVAKAAGVTAGTVSRSLNAKTQNQIGKETVGKIQRIAKELGYEVDAFARGLRTQKSFTVGIVIPDLTNPIFPPLVRGIDSHLMPRGYSSYVVNTDGSLKSEKTLINSLMARRVDGLILATGRGGEDLIQDFHSRGVQAVMVNRELLGVSFPSVTSDDRAGISAAIEHLASLGHQKFIHLAGPSDSSTSLVRSRAFKATIDKQGLSGRIIKASAYSVMAGRLAMDKFLDHSNDSFTALVAGNDLLALGAYHSFQSHNLRCPEDISVTGFNNMPFTEDFQPPLTTINAHHYEMGVEAARLLLDQFHDPERPIMKVILPVSLVLRASTGPVL